MIETGGGRTFLKSFLFLGSIHATPLAAVNHIRPSVPWTAFGNGYISTVTRIIPLARWGIYELLVKGCVSLGLKLMSNEPITALTRPQGNDLLAGRLRL